MHNAYYNCTNLPFPVAGSSDKLSSPGVSVKPIRSTNSIHHNGTAHTRTHAHTHTPESSFKTSLKTSISPLAVVRDFFEALSELRGAVRVFLGEN